ncbi:hypothetical protein CSHISOI_07759 [Colletotrichum shisoi]|uniref:Uncharacterized protein n=1 Tax=Colletotrichum shisoi TaxID=2078593 RepID=A0A5Q4BMH2_9PEZI|nr:hypothetical protein CSHISOI_07759 [Colletotrichum shisoi]
MTVVASSPNPSFLSRCASAAAPPVCLPGKKSRLVVLVLVVVACPLEKRQFRMRWDPTSGPRGSPSHASFFRFAFHPQRRRCARLLAGRIEMLACQTLMGPRS